MSAALVPLVPRVTASDIARSAGLSGAGRARVRVQILLDAPAPLCVVTVLVRNRVHQRGFRWRCRCPACGTPRDCLHVHDGRIACRGCLYLTYPSWLWSGRRWWATSKQILKSLRAPGGLATEALQVSLSENDANDSK